ncbi:MAG: FtsX-like permease family protein, partial [Spirochaetota bacterium]|nr:FtsX-like permease family protein [Spirochaetota bacterium]
MKTFSRAVNLIRIVLFPYFRQHKIKVLLSIFGVALGVAVFIAIRSASVSAKHAMKNLVTSFSSEIDLQVTYGRDGFYETVYPKIALLPGVKKAIPVIYAKTSLKQGDKEYPIQVYGVDITQGGDAGADAGTGGDLGRFLSLPNELLVSESFLEAHGLNKESPISLVTGRGRVRFHVAGVMKAGSMAYSKNKNMVIMDLFAAQYHFEKKGKLDRVDIDVADGYDPEKVKASIIAATGGILRVRTPDERVSQAGSIFQSFELNLTVVSMISLLVGMYLIYNTINTSILHQRREIGILRALGATQADIMMLFSLEGALIGIVGSALGLALGWLLASVSVEAFTHNLSRHYLLPDVTAIHFSGEYLVLGFAVGMGMTLLSSVIPSMATVKISPIETIRSVSFENIKRFRVNKVSIAGLGILVLAYFSSQGDPVNGIPVFGFTANLLIIV